MHLVKTGAHSGAVKGLSFRHLTVSCLALCAAGFAQTAQAGPLQSGSYTFNITSSDSPAGTCNDPAVDDICAHILNSITIGGTTYTDLTYPSGFSVSGFPAGSDVQSRIYDTPGDFDFSSSTYSADMLTNVFSDRDLNRYQQVDSNADVGSSNYTFPSPIPATGDFFLVTTERNGNNDQVIEAFDQNGASLGTVMINADTADYSDTNRQVGFDQNSFLAVIPMSDFADASDATRQVQSINISYTEDDGADHKTFVIGSATVATIDAVQNDYTATPIDGGTGGTVGSVLGNDTLGDSAVAADGSQTTLTLTDLGGLTGATISDDGTITVPAGTEAGTYTLTYDLCDEALASNCDTATVMIEVTAPVIDAVADDFSATPIIATVGGTVGSVLADDTVDGTAAATDGSGTTLALTDLDGLTGATISDDGTITVPAGAAPGTYNLTYDLCDEAITTNCDTAVATIVVINPVIDAVEDDYTASPVSSADGGTVGSVLANDTVNASAVKADGSETTLTLTDLDGLTGATIADDGTITVPAGSTPGTYALTYDLCDGTDTTICDTAVATVVVTEVDLIPEIEDDLLAILEDDLSATLIQQGAVMGDYAAGALSRLRGQGPQACAEAATMQAKGIYFDTDKAIIKPQSDAVIDELAVILQACEGSTFEIGGHTDSDASDAYNIALSQRRVNAVLAALQARDLDTSGYVAQGYGESRPIATNATAEGKAQNRRVEFTVLDEATVAQAQAQSCINPNAPQHSFDARANNAGVAVDGSLHSESYNCLTGNWAIVSGGISYLETDSGIAQGNANLSYRKERFFGEDAVRGFFVGGYGSQTDVDTRATGDINGFGLNAGIYGAERLRDAIYLDYYLGAAAGQHDFDLTFANPGGDIDATGDYSYFAGFAGAALSGEATWDAYILAPRAGFEYAFSPGGDVDVRASRDGLSQTGMLDLDGVDGGLFFLELRAERAFDRVNSFAAFTPRVSCYESYASLDGDCSVGATFEFQTQEDAEDLIYGVMLEGERGDNFSRGSLSAHVARQMGSGLLGLETGVAESGAVHVSSKLEFKF